MFHFYGENKQLLLENYHSRSNKVISGHMAYMIWVIFYWDCVSKLYFI